MRRYGESMEKSSFGQILALVGLIVFVFSGIGRQRSRRRSQAPPPAPTTKVWQKSGTIVAIALIIIGLVLMTMGK
jgi:hypothetical protein